MEFKEEMVSQETVYEGVIVNVRRDKARLMDGRITDREVVEHPGGVAVFAMDDQGRVALVRQYRYPYAKVLLEVPAGKLEYGEDHFEAAKRELSEEIGAEAREWIPMGEMLPTPGFCDELQPVYLARGLTFGQMHPDEDEFLERVKMPLSEAVEMAIDGRLEDSKTVASILRAAGRLKKL